MYINTEYMTVLVSKIIWFIITYLRKCLSAGGTTHLILKIQMENVDDVHEFTLGQHSDSEAEMDSDSEDEDQIPQNENAWNQEFCPTINEFAFPESLLKPEIEIDASTTPFELLKIYVTQDMIETICKESCRYVEQIRQINQTSMKKWYPVTQIEMWRFLALNMAMGINWRPSISDYWSTNEIIFSPIYSKTMSRNRFQDILRSLHFVNNETVPDNNKEKYIKLGTFLEDLVKNFKSVVNPSEYLCLDESLIPFKGRVSIRQYNPKKRGRFGLKFFVLVDCATHLTLDLIPYQGKATKINTTHVKTMGFGGAAVLTMLDDHLHKSHKIIIDNYFNSPSLGMEIVNNGTHILGTVQKRRKLMPKMTSRLKKGEIEIYCNGQLLVERWRDRREVVMLNSFVPHEMKPAPSKYPGNTKNKPESVLIYNKKMGGVDEMDKCIRPYSHDRRTYKWYKKAFFYLIDVAIYNAYKLYLMFRPSKSYKDFVLSLIDEILKKNIMVRNVKGRPAAHPKTSDNGLHLPIKVKTANGTTSLSDCVMCRKQGKRKQTSFKCEHCNKRLCITEGYNCFKQFHAKLTPHSHSETDFVDQIRVSPVFNTVQPIDVSNDSVLAPPTSCNSSLCPESQVIIPCSDADFSLSNINDSVNVCVSVDENSNSISLLNDLYV